jgi:hypothetical protein
MQDSQIALKMKEQIVIFSGILSKGLPKLGKKFVREAIFGIQARQSVRLTEISRSLEEKIALKKTQDRLCRQLNRKSLGERVGYNVLEQAGKRIKADTLLILDTSDITKKYAEKMEYLAGVHDGSAHEIGKGYWTVQVIGAELEEQTMSPLYAHLYSQEAPEYEGENVEILKAIDQVSGETQGKGIWVMDRGGDRKNLIGPMLERNLRFILRMVGTRDLIYRGRRVLVKDLSMSCAMRYAERIVKEEQDEEKVYNIEFGALKVKLPGCSENLRLVVVRGFGTEPMMLLTSLGITHSRKSLLNVVLYYVRRWQIEETIRFAKQAYQLEDIRLLTYRRLQNMMVLVLGAMYFACVWLGDRLKLSVLMHHALKAAKRLFGIPDFRYYAIADGIKEIFSHYKARFDTQLCSKPINLQLLLIDS